MTLRHIVPTCLLVFNSSVLIAQIAPENTITDYNERISEINSLNKIILPDNLSDEQRQCMQFLYAYMPLPDFTDRSPEYYLEEVVDPALKARAEMPWGTKVPDREFRHFVLPMRVNNEALDTHRKEFYDELKDRVKNLSMKDAILEINHWCHEKVTYQPSDGRTHSPLQSVSSAIGRCGEESTFTVAALRAMGIPARQVYTPRWAHTDDNHAWVEAWADGKWYFLGACEPEPVLNLGWFNSPASRGMLMHARVFGKYTGDEEILNVLHGNTDINVTDHYAPVDTLNVTITDIKNNPINNAKVSFRVYNYAEFYPIATKYTDASGNTSLISGCGDIIVWATDGKNYGFKKASVGKDKTVSVTLDLDNNSAINSYLDIVPPKASDNSTEVTDAVRAENNRRMAHEDSIRHSYTATFVNQQQSDELADKWGLDRNRVWNIMKDARGNHATLIKFMDETSANKEKAFSLLEALTKKDLSDVPYNILTDHVAASEYGGDMFAKYVMSPRIDVEELTPYRSFFNSVIKPTEMEIYRTNPTQWINWINTNIVTDLDWYPSQITMSPKSVWEYRRTSPYSRDIFFVAGARSMGIPARIDPVTGKTQWADNSGSWHDAVFNNKKTEKTHAEKGNLVMPYKPTRTIPDPKYYTHFTISKIDNGEPQLLSYPDFIGWSETFKNPQALDAGKYMIVTGQRMANGSVLASTDIIDVLPNSEITVDTLTIRQDSTGVQVIGTFDAESRYKPKEENTEKSVLATTGRGYYVLGIIKPNHEPTNHALRDIAAYDGDLKKWGRSIVLLYDTPEDAARMDMSQLPKLPSTVTFGNDIDGSIVKRIKDGLNLTSNDYPIFIIADTFNRVVFVSQGYTIGLGQKIIDTVSRLE